MTERLRYFAYDHQGKAELYLRALDSRYQRIRATAEDPYPPVDFVLSDNDVRGRRSHLERLRKNGAEHFFIYPHAARPNLQNDIRATWPHTTAQFVAAQGHLDVMRRFGYDKPVHVVGWNLCPLRSFQRRERVYRVLFAPIHPRCALIDQKINRAAYSRLADLAVQGRIFLIVRHIGSLIDAGIYPIKHRRIRYTAGDTRPSWDQIDQADVVVSHQTFAWLAVARGVPTVMMGEAVPTHLVPKNQDALYARHWEAYADLLTYPLDLLREKDTLGLLLRAADSDAEIAAWRERMIGRAFDAERFLEHVECYVRDWRSDKPRRIPKIKSRYQGREDIYYVVNPLGAVHDCKQEQAAACLARDGYRLATDDEIRDNLTWGIT